MSKYRSLDHYPPLPSRRQPSPASGMAPKAVSIDRVAPELVRIDSRHAAAHDLLAHRVLTLEHRLEVLTSLCRHLLRRADPGLGATFDTIDRTLARIAPLSLNGMPHYRYPVQLPKRLRQALAEKASDKKPSP